MYEKVEEIFHFEFGFFYSEGNIEVIAINHTTSQIRTLGNCTKEDDAEFILETCIQFGFREYGMIFERIPGYQLERKVEVAQVL